MSENIQQRSSIKFCVKNDISAAETLRMLQKAFGEQAMSKTQAYEWHKMFKEGREGVEDEPHQRRPRTSTDEQHVAKIKELVLQNRRLTTRELADIIGISNGSVNTILKEVLCLKKVKSRLVPKTQFFGKTASH